MHLDWLSFRCANRIPGTGHSHTPFFQVLTGGLPFPDIQDSAVAYHVLRGKRPIKPANASAIGFSDSLWAFTQNCWDGEMKSRPKVKEVVTHLGEAMADWVGLMPPCSLAGDVGLDSGKPSSDSGESSEFDVLILLRFYPSSNCTDFFPSSTSDTQESSIQSQTTSELLRRRNTKSTQLTDPQK